MRFSPLSTHQSSDHVVSEFHDSIWLTVFSRRLSVSRFSIKTPILCALSASTMASVSPNTIQLTLFLTLFNFQVDGSTLAYRPMACCTAAIYPPTRKAPTLMICPSPGSSSNLFPSAKFTF